MRPFLVSMTGLMLLAAAGSAQARVDITVDKDAQAMTVAVDGVARYRWPVSTGNPSHETPNGSFRTFRMEEDHYSKEFDDAPMPHSIFFTKVGHAIHGTDSEGKLGAPVSHGCVRLSRDHAATLYALVQQQGVLNTNVTLTGSSRVALARLQQQRPGTMVARRSVPQPVEVDQASVDQPYADQGNAGYGASQNTGYGAGQPAAVAPLPPPQQVYARPVAPRVADDGYIYPADGASDGRRYPAPPGYRRSNGQAQPQYEYDATAQAYVPRPAYQPRGFFGGYQDN